jgi:hypothetical protein
MDRYEQGQPLRLYIPLTLMSLPLAAVTQTTSVAITMLLFFWSMFVAAGFVVTALRSGARMYPAGQRSMVAGIAAGSWSALVAVLLPIFGAWFDQQRYTQTFVLISVMPVAGTLAWWLLTRSNALQPNQE